MVPSTLARAQVAPAGEQSAGKITGAITRGQAPAGTVLDGEVMNRFVTGAASVDPLQTYLVTTVRDAADETLGATLEPVSDPLRAQLALPADQGLMVAAVTGDGPAARAGLEQNDILLALADKPLAKADDLSEQLKVAGKSAVALKLLRKGKPVILKVRPVFRVTLDAADEQAADYYIGMMVDTPEDALRAHLGLPEGKGLIATRIVGGSPAEKAGVMTHDILLELGGKPIDSTETLIAQVQAAKDKPTPLKLLRASKPLTIEITPERRVAQEDSHRETLRLWTLGVRAHPDMFRQVQRHPERWNALGLELTPRSAEPDPTTTRLDALDDDLKALRKAVDELRDALKREK
jgi:membrane-associated protease RseP (regulator of RpoE activity)